MAGQGAGGSDADRQCPWALRLRVPGWCGRASVTVSTCRPSQWNWLGIARQRRRGDVAVLDLPMPELTAVPYFAWANREPGGMRVWLPGRPG